MTEQIRLISEELSHPVMKGTSGEEVIVRFLKTHLPTRYAIGQGKVVDFLGNESKQVDILIYDALDTVPFFKDDKNVIIPVEHACAIIEVKTTLNKTKFIESMEVFKSAYNLQSPLEYSFVLGGVAVKKVPSVVNITNHPKCFVIGLDSSKGTTVETLMQNYLAYVKEGNFKFPLASFCGVLDKGFFIDVLDEQNAESLQDPCEVYFSDAQEDTLLFFLLNLIQTMQRSVGRQPDYELYLNAYKKFGPKRAKR